MAIADAAEEYAKAGIHGWWPNFGKWAFDRLGIAIPCGEERQLGASNETRRCRSDDVCDDLLCSAAALDNCSRCRTLDAIKLLSAN
jgi:hypothetical protein